MSHLADVEALRLFISSLRVRVEVLQVEEVVVVVNIDAHAPLRSHVESVSELKVRVDLDSPVLPKHKRYMVILLLCLTGFALFLVFLLLVADRGVLDQL